MESQYVKIINGDLLESDCEYIIHQCNCVSNNAQGIAKKIFEKYKYANTYRERVRNNKETYSRPGTIEILGNGTYERYIINMYSQFYPREAKFSNDSSEKRLIWFKECLAQVAEIKNLKSVGLPFNIGCGFGGGDWNKYYEEIIKFADIIKKPVIIYKFDSAF